MRRGSTRKMLFLPKLIGKFNAIPLKKYQGRAELSRTMLMSLDSGS